MKLAIVIPAYNEEKRIGVTLEAYSKFFAKSGVKYSMVVVINGTTDRTEDVVKSYQKKDNNIVIINLKKGGKGLAINEGFAYALNKNYDLIGFVDADLATTPDEYWKLVKSIGNFDGVIADRYMKGSNVTPPYTFRRLLVSRVFNFVVRALFLLPYSDTQCGAKLFKRYVIKKVLPLMTITQWAYDVNLLHECKLSGFDIKAVTTDWVEIEGSHLRIIRASVQMMFAIIQLRLLKSPFRRMLYAISPTIGMIYKLLGK